MGRLRRQARQLSRYSLVGLVTNFSLYGLFILLLQFALQPVPAAGVCYLLGLCASYLLNRTWSFASGDSHRKDLPKFLLAYGIGFVSTLLTMALLTSWLPSEWAQIINIGLTAIVIYASLWLLRFGGESAG